jgi:hypothetical protein
VHIQCQTGHPAVAEVLASLSYPKHDLAEHVSVFDSLMGLCRLGQIEFGGYRHLQQGCFHCHVQSFELANAGNSIIGGYVTTLSRYE